MKHPYSTLLGVEIVEVGVGTAQAVLTATEEHTNKHGFVHGGLLYSLADIAFEFASNSHQADAVGITTNMQFHRAVSPGDQLVAMAREIHLGRKLATYLIEVTCENKVVASFTGTVYRMEK